MLFLPSNQLSYPAGVAPGFDPYHVASAGCKMSAVASYNTGLTNVMTGAASSITAGSPTTAIHSTLGPVVNVGTTSDRLKFTSNTGSINLASGSNNFTLAVMAMPVTTGSDFPVFFCAGVSSGQVPIQGYQGTWCVNPSGGTTIHTTSTIVPMTTLTPYFAVVSVNPSGSTFVVRNLKTGQIYTQVLATTSVAATTDGTYQIFGGAGQTPTAGTQLAAMMASNQTMSQGAMLEWANDPWSFWYPASPNSTFYPFDLTVGVTGVIVTKYGNTLLMGM